MANVSKLAGSKQSVCRDFPDEIREARSRLWPERKAAKARGDTVKIVYPAKLLVNQQVVRDEFPDWFEMIHGLKLSKATTTRPKTTPATEHKTVAAPEVVVETESTGDSHDSDSESESSSEEDGNRQFHDT